MTNRRRLTLEELRRIAPPIPAAEALRGNLLYQIRQRLHLDSFEAAAARLEAIGRPNGDPEVAAVISAMLDEPPIVGSTAAVQQMRRANLQHLLGMASGGK